jgi:outer membrane autotransporter protein
LGAGGGIFVQQGGTLTLGGPLTVNGNSVTGGTGGGANNGGSALGGGLFLQGNGTLTLSPGAGQTQTVSDAIADQTGSGGTGGNAGSYTLQKQGAGMTILSGVNSYTGGTTVSAGTLQGTTASLQGNIVNNAALVFDQSGNGSYSSAISGTGILTKAGNGTVTLAGSNTYQGGTTISGGTIAINNASALGTGTVSLSGGSLTGAATLTLANDITFAAGAGVIAATTGTTLTLAPNTLSFSLVPDTLMTFGSATDAGTVVYSAATSFITNIAFSTVVAGGTLRAGANTFGALTGNDRATTVVNAGATLDFNDFASTVANLQGGGSVLTGASAATAITIAQGNFSGAIGGAGQLVKTGAGTLTLTGANTYSGGTTVSGGTLQGTSTSLQGAITNNANVSFDQGFTGTYAGAMSGSGSLTKSGSATLLLTGANTYGGGTMINGGTLSVSADANLGNAAGALIFGGGTLQTTASVITARATTLNAGGGTFDTAASTTLVHSGAIGGAGSLTKTGTGTLLLTGNNFYAGGTTVSGGILQGTPSSLQGNILNNASVWLTGSGTYGGNMSGSGGLLINSTGTLTLSGVNSYTGGTTVSGGVLQGNTQSLQGNILNNASIVFNQTGSGTYAGVMSGSGSMTVQGGGLLNLTGNGTYTGPTTVNASTLAVNGSLASSVNLVNGAVLMGNGSMGGLASSGGVLAPGNSIGTLTVNGTFSQLGGVYQVEANAQGQSDRINVTGTATIGGGATVQVLAQPGNYTPNTTYTILRANGGVSGTYSGVSSNFAFLTPSLSYDANDVFLTLSLQQNAFSSFGGNTANQRAVGAVLDQTFGSASGDYATVLNAIATLSATQGPLALNAISGQQYAGFSNALVQGAQLFLSNFSNQAGGSGANKVALAEACVVACDATEPAVWGAWGGAVGGTGTIAGNSNAGTFTYSVGGFSGGLDRKVAPNFLAGVTVGYLTGGQWTGGFDGRSVTNTVQAGAYASFTQGPVYVDGIAAYAYSANQMWRSITISGLQPRTAYGRTGANQFLGQLETGYRVELGGTAAAYLTPFARVQGSTATQNAFTETGAQSLNLSVAAQTTSSLRTVFGAQLGAALDVGLRDRIAAQLKLGWSHEYADTARPVTASFVGAPAVPFTVQGATPTRDGAVIGFSASTALADALGVYVRYEGTISGQDSSHALTAGLRATW